MMNRLLLVFDQWIQFPINESEFKFGQIETGTRFNQGIAIFLMSDIRLIIFLFQCAAIAMRTTITDIRGMRKRRADFFLITLAKTEAVAAKATVSVLKTAMRLTDASEPAFKAMHTVIHHADLRIRGTITDKQMVSNFAGDRGGTFGK